MKNIYRFQLVIANLVYVIFTVQGETNCDTLGVNFYENIGCSKQDTGGDCPSYSDCKYERQPGKCLYNGVVIDNSNPIGPEQDTLCSFGCICSAENNAKGKFVCAQGQCGFWSLPPDPKCYTEYKLNECCGERRCKPSKATCTVDGKTYKEGEKLYAKDECSVCICTSEFNGKFEGPHCKRTGCDIEARHSEDIENNCAPIYFVKKQDDLLCCPVTFVCPSDEDKFTGKPTSDVTCKYGDKPVKAGVTLTRINGDYGKNRTVTCECKLPPLLTCTMET